MYAGTRIWSSYGLVQLARWRHCVSWSLGCLTSTWDIAHGTSQHLTLFAARSSFPKMSNVGMSHVRSQMHLSNNQITHSLISTLSGSLGAHGSQPIAQCGQNSAIILPSFFPKYDEHERRLGRIDKMMRLIPSGP